MHPVTWAAYVLILLTAGALVTWGLARWRGLCGWFAVVATALALVSALRLSLAVAESGTPLRGEVANLGLVGARLGFHVDGVSAVLMVLVLLVGLLCAVFSTRYLGEADAAATARYYPAFLLFLAGMCGVLCLSDWLFFLVAWEFMSLPAYLLIVHDRERPEALRAGLKYFLMTHIGNLGLFVGVLVLYRAASPGGSFDFAAVSGALGALIAARPWLAGIVVGLMALAFMTKAGVFPMGDWLPDAHAEAPSPVSVLLSGIMIKVAAYALARTAVPFFTAWPALQVMLVAMATLTMLVGIALVAAQVDLKRLLAYSSVSQIGYVILGFGLGSYLGVFAALYHVLAHAAAKSLLFMGAGAVEQSTGTRRLDELRGLRVSMPITSACFLVGVLTLSGVPLLAGFVSKFSLFLATVQLGGFWWAGAIAILTGVLTLVVMTRVVVQVFWRAEGEPARARSEVSAAMVGSMVVLALLCVLLGTGPTLLWPALSQATQALLGSTQPVGGLIAAFRP